MKIGYARVSTGLQNLHLQEDRLNAYGCEKIFNDHMSGSKSKRPGLDKAIEFARSGDTIVVWRLDRLGWVPLQSQKSCDIYTEKRKIINTNKTLYC